MSAPSRTKDERYELKRLAARARGLYRSEKQALAWLADVQTMQNGVCRKALKSGEDLGYHRKSIQRGIHGKRRNGKIEYPGLLARGIVSVSEYVNGGRAPGGSGLTPAYVINRDALLTYIPDVEDDPPTTPMKVDTYVDTPAKKVDTYVDLMPTSSLRSSPNKSSLRHPVAAATSNQGDSPARQRNDSLHDTATQQHPHAVRPKPAAPAGNLPSNQLEGRQDGFVNDSALDEQRDESEPICAQAKRRMRQSYAIAKATQFRDLPTFVRQTVATVRQKCRLEWDYYRTHDEDGTVLGEGDYRLSVFPSPKADSQLELAKQLLTYTPSQLVNAWKKFVNRPLGFDGLEFPWRNFFLEFDDYVEA
ncbi:MAG TPA: hypothetical protein VN822_10270, partial [Candidatus Acidoferrales bacterium]|nr:hypothetical protein [Candidatus Acidoferrales bacterium]